MRVTGFARAKLRLRIYANIKNMKMKKRRIPQLRYTETRLAANAVKNAVNCLREEAQLPFQRTRPPFPSF